MKDRKRRIRSGAERLDSRTLLASVTWDGGAGTQLWTDPLNWSGDALPGASDDVVIDIPSGNPNLYLWNTTVAVNSLTSNETLDLSGVTLTLNAASSIRNLVLGNAQATTINGAGDLTIANSASWRNGTFAGTGKLIVASSATLTFEPMNSLQRILSRTLENYGTVMWRQTLSMHFNGGTLINHGTITHTTLTTTGQTHSYLALGGTNQIINRGMISGLSLSNMKFGIPVVNESTGQIQATSAYVFFDQTLDNRGILNAADDGRVSLAMSTTNLSTSRMSGTGRFDFTGGTHVLEPTFYLVSGRTIVAGATVTFNVVPIDLGPLGGQTTFNVPMSFSSFTVHSGANAVFNAHVSITGSMLVTGNVTFNSTTSTSLPSLETSGTIHFTQPATLNIASLKLNGTLNTPADINVTTSFNWSFGTFQGLGTTTLAAGLVTNLIGPTSTLERRLVNLGTLQHTASTNLRIQGAGTLENHGVYENLTTSNSARVTGDGLFINHGTIRNNATGLVTFELPLDNRATVSIGASSGGYRFFKDSVPALINSGTITVAATGKLGVKTMTLLPGSRIEGEGTVTFDGGFNTLEPDTFAGTLRPLFGNNCAVTVNRELTLSGTTPTSIYSMGGSVTFNVAPVFTGRFRVYGTLTFNVAPVFVDTVTVDGTNTPGTLVLNVDTDIAQLVLTNARLDGAGNVDLTGTFTSSSGFLQGTGIVRINAGLDVDLGGYTYIGRTLINDGTIHLDTGGYCYLSNGTLINNGLFTSVVTSSPTRLEPLCGTNRFINNGTFELTDVGTFHVDVPMENYGIVHVQKGQLFVNAGLGDGTSSALTGNWYVMPDTQLRFAQNILSVAGTLRAHANAYLTGLSALQSSSGTIELRQGATLVLSPVGAFVNAGTLRIASGCLFSVNGNMGFSGDGTLITEITAFSGGGAGRTVVTGTLNLDSPDGRSRVATQLIGIDPPASSLVTFVTAGNLIGALDAFSAAISPSGRSTALSRSGNALDVRLLDGPASSLPTPAVSSIGFDHATRQAVVVSFNTDVWAFLSRKDLVLVNLAGGPAVSVGSLAYDAGSYTATLLLTNQLANGSYRLTFRNTDIANATGIEMIPAIGYEFFILAGDVNRDRSVNFDDLLVLAQNYGSGGATLSGGDVNYDSVVDFNDLLVLAQNYGSTFSVTPIARSTRGRIAGGVLA